MEEPKNTIAYKIFKESKNNFLDSLFDEVSYNFYAMESVPGAGKTTAIRDYLAYIYSDGSTANDYQVYKISEEEEKIIPAGEVNKWELIKRHGLKKGEELFNLKTKNGMDFSLTFLDKNALIVVFNADIKKEIERSLKKHPVLKDPFERGQITIKTSHSLLFGLAKQLDIIPTEKDEEGEYSINGIKTDFSKGDFYFNDVLKVKKYLEQINVFKNAFEKKTDKEIYAFFGLLYDFINVYYNTDIIIENPKELDLLFDKVNKKKNQEDFDAVKEIVKFFSKKFENLEEAKEFAGKIITAFLINFKKAIENGEVKVGHSFYYKEAFLEALKDKEVLKRLFSINYTGNLTYDMIIVDEAQDLTPIMARLLGEFYKFNTSEMLIVGDPKQAIYAFSERINAFKVFKETLGDKLKEYINPYTYRLPKEICNYVNEECKKLCIYDEKTKLIPKNDKEGFVKEGEIFIENVIIKALKENEPTAVIGRTNAEILVEFIKIFNVLKEKKEEHLLKYLKINSKMKKEFKKLLEKGLMGIEDNNLKQTIQILTGKENPSFEDILKDDLIKTQIPHHIVEFAQSLQKYKKSGIEEALNFRPSPKANVEFITAHASKGREFENVIVLKDIFENAIKGNENEKFLYYVALTRTKNRLFVEKEMKKPKLKLYLYENESDKNNVDKKNIEDKIFLDLVIPKEIKKIQKQRM